MDKKEADSLHNYLISTPSASAPFRINGDPSKGDLPHASSFTTYRTCGVCVKLMLWNIAGWARKCNNPSYIDFLGSHDIIFLP